MSTALRAVRDWRGGWIAPHLRRRILAALLAAAGVLVALSSLRPAVPAAPARTAAPSPPAALLSRLAAGLVAAPVRLVDPGVAPLLHTGMRVDVLAAPESPTGSVDTAPALARVVARGVRVLAVTATATADSNLGTLVVLAVTPADAQALAGAEASGRLSVTLDPG